MEGRLDSRKEAYRIFGMLYPDGWIEYDGKAGNTRLQFYPGGKIYTYRGQDPETVLWRLREGHKKKEMARE